MDMSTGKIRRSGIITTFPMCRWFEGSRHALIASPCGPTQALGCTRKPSM